ncbi:MAG TPA: guanylate kinase [Candidatus Acidoferrales bacterium]|nr:guanylate kinase [Candidatus Acidoferrales bacterium]
MPASHPPLTFIVSGPSGCGKSTLVEKMLELPKIMFSISCTTRKPRAAEDPGKWYNFVTEEEFERMVERGEFLEHARVFGRSYGTPKRWLEEAGAKHWDLVLEIDVQGAAQVRQSLPDSVSIFILPPSREALGQRLRNRGQDSEEEIERRLAQARQEILEHLSHYDYIVINDELEHAGRRVQAIVRAARSRSKTALESDTVRNVLHSFGG